MPGFEFFRSMLQHASASGSRSTVLQPLLLAMTILIPGLLGAIYYGAPFWVLVLLGFFLAATLTIFLIFFVFYGIKSPDLLRSERFMLSKMAIEKNIIGD